jgi:hypothetical protein
VEDFVELSIAMIDEIWQTIFSLTKKTKKAAAMAAYVPD